MKPTVRMLFDCKTVDDVVVLLRKFKIRRSKYKRFSGKFYASCPISSYLRKATHKRVNSWSHLIELNGKQIWTPLAVSTFIYGFDRGVYPEFK